MNLGSRHPAELLTAVGTELNSSPPCPPPSQLPCRSAGTARTPACRPNLFAPLPFDFSANLSTTHRTMAPTEALWFNPTPTSFKHLHSVTSVSPLSSSELRIPDFVLWFRSNLDLSEICCPTSNILRQGFSCSCQRIRRGQR